MTNTSLLKDYIRRSGYRKSYIAKCVGISAYTFALKCENKSEFKATEIDVICELLKIGIEDRMSIFFAK